jgi:hypothetical protein
MKDPTTNDRQTGAPAPARALLPGAIRQTGHVVRDLDAGMARWLTLGVGPWFVLPPAPQPVTFRGDAVAPVVTIAFANSGALQVELIAPLDATPSLYREFLDAGHEGLHHHAWWTADFDGATARAAAGGWDLVVSGDGNGFARYCYLERPDLPGVLVEIMELTEVTEMFMTAIRRAAVEWDGTDPVR